MTDKPLAILALILVFLIGVTVGLSFVYYVEFHENKPMLVDMNKQGVTNTTLYQILDYEIDLLENSSINTTDWVCRHYARYFNDTLHIKYPELDIRWIQHMDMCNNLTICDELHSYIDVGGYNQLCQINSDNFYCWDF